MKKYIRRAVSALIALIMIFYPVPGVLRHVHAASFPLQLSVESYQSGELELSWPGLPGTKSVVVKYHYLDEYEAPAEWDNTFNQEGSLVSISNLQNDTVYDIEIKVYNAENGSGTEIGHGLIYFIPRMTFYASTLEQYREPMEGGGFEIGVEPGLNLRWAMPRVYDGTDFVDLDEALNEMEARLNDVYGEQRELNSLGFRINVSTDATKLNSGSMENSIIIDSDTPEYTAYVSGNPSIESKVRGPDGAGFMDFDLIGRKDVESDPPAAQGDYQLRDWDILPGTVYYMNVKPVFFDSSGEFQNAVTVGPHHAQNGSLLSGPFNYTYTPIRFQLTRDSLNNVYVKIFKVNHGSLDLPRMYYQVQTSDDPSILGDWSVRKTLDDTYFGGEYAVTVITGISPGNTLYYKIVVKTDTQDDRLESPPLPYALWEDSIKAPVPAGVAVTERTLRSGQANHPETGEEVSLRSTDIVLTWEKPDGWETLIEDNLYFHVLLNTVQSAHDMEAPLYLDGQLWGNYHLNYRLVKYISAQSENIIDNGSSLSYRINGFDLFAWEDENGEAHGIPNDDNYPGFLLPNTVYYLQMYTTSSENKGTMDPEYMSDRSLTISFTTLRQEERDIPLPGDFSIYSNGVDESGNNRIELQFTGLREQSIDWYYYTSQPDDDDRIYYDLYMSTRAATDSFVLLGSTEHAGDVVFHTETTDKNVYITAAISSFAPESEAYSAFGERLKPNTTYYFMAKTRLSMENEDEDKESLSTALMPVTTAKLVILPPDESDRKPLAPTEFSVAEDSEGNPMVNDTDVSLQWFRRETDATYELICTRERVLPEAGVEEYENDPLYIDFIDTYGNRDNDGDDGVFMLDPEADLDEGFFEYVQETGLLTMHVKNWLFPNRLYYFSIRAVNENGVSVWISLPVTTLPVEMPAWLEPVVDVQAMFSYTDTDPNSRSEDFSIRLKGPGDDKYRELTRSRFAIARDGARYYVRISNLEPDSSYDIRVYKGENTSNPFYQIRDYETRDNRHQIHVKWKGRDGFRFQMELKEETSSSYIPLDDSDYNLYVEKTHDTAGTQYSVYHAIIRRAALLVMPDGSAEKTPLFSNTAYNIRIRTRKVDPLDYSIVSYSKFTPAIRVRTEFDQQDYDREDDETRKKAAFLDRIHEIEEDIYWRVDITSGKSCTILLKQKRVLNLMNELSGIPLVVNLEQIAPEMNRYVVFVPSEIVEAGNRDSSCITFALPGARFSLRPGWVSSGMEEIAVLHDKKNVKDLYYRLEIEEAGNDVVDAPGKAALLSNIWKLSASAEGLSVSMNGLEERIHDRLYNEETGLVNEKIEEFMRMYKGSLQSAVFGRYITGFVNLIKNELSLYIKEIMGVYGVRNAVVPIKRFKVPAFLEIDFKHEEGTVVPYARYTDTKIWRKIDGPYAAYKSGRMDFDVDGEGWFAVALMWQLPEHDRQHPASEYVLRLMSLYDLTEVFNGFEYTLRLDRSVTAREAVIFYEILSGRTCSTVLDVGTKAAVLGLDGYIDTRRMNKNITRQETAGVLFALFAAKTGMVTENWKPNSLLWIKDAQEISDRLYTPVEFTVENGIFALIGGGYFHPGSEISRGELCEAVSRLLDLAGE